MPYSQSFKRFIVIIPDKPWDGRISCRSIFYGVWSFVVEHGTWNMCKFDGASKILKNPSSASIDNQSNDTVHWGGHKNLLGRGWNRVFFCYMVVRSKNLKQIFANTKILKKIPDIGSNVPVVWEAFCMGIHIKIWAVFSKHIPTLCRTLLSTAWPTLLC